MTQEKRHYGLFTTVTMIVGIVIGSGIFFKTDNILVATNGNVALGIVMFVLAALAIVFGCLTISNLAAQTDKPGGMIAYFEEFIGKKMAGAFGWFQAFVYYPTLTVLLCWVVGIYTGVLFGWELSFDQMVLIGVAWFTICFTFNMISAKLGGAFQNASTIIKLIPLVLIGVFSFFSGNPVAAVTHPSTIATGKNWLTSLGPISFMFDGWVIATAIGFQIRDSKKNLPRALVFSPLFILIAYLIYFVGISSLIGIDNVMQQGDASAINAATQLFGAFASKALNVFVVISVMGTANGIILGFIRLPYSLALKGMLPGSNWLRRTDASNGMSINSGLYAILICAVWWVVHYVTMTNNLLPNSDVSEIAIAMSYFLYIFLYVRVFLFWREGKIKGFARGVIFPLLASVGAGIIVFGATQTPSFPLYIGISLTVLVAGYLYASKSKVPAIENNAADLH